MRLLILFLLIISGTACAPAEPAVVTRVATPTPAPAPSSTPLHSKRSEPIAVKDVAVLSQTVAITFTAQGQKEYLFDTPTLAGQRATPKSIEQAHFDLLSQVTQGQGRASLTFPKPTSNRPWRLVFNPQHKGNDYVAPRVEVEVK